MAEKYSRILRVYGPDSGGGEIEFNQRVLHFLNQSFPETIAQFEALFKEATDAVLAEPLGNYKSAKHFQEYWWPLTCGSQPITDWNYLTYTDPRETGILCSLSDQEKPVLFSKENVPTISMSDKNNPKIDAVEELHFHLVWWRYAVCAVWAGIIAKNFIHLLRQFKGKNSPVLLSPFGGLVDTDNQPSKKEVCENDGPIGKVLELSDISDSEADDFYKLCYAAHLGSWDCEQRAAIAFKEWLRTANIRQLQGLGVTLPQASSILYAGSQARPSMDVKLQWAQEAGDFRFMCLVKNKDIHGYNDPEKSSGINQAVLFRFYQESAPEVKTDIIRLLLRAAKSEIQWLLISKLVTGYIST